jgi:hypothetical protein
MTVHFDGMVEKAVRYCRRVAIDFRNNWSKVDDASVVMTQKAKPCECLPISQELLT